jgi:hypothetical protein
MYGIGQHDRKVAMRLAAPEILPRAAQVLQASVGPLGSRFVSRCRGAKARLARFPAKDLLRRGAHGSFRRQRFRPQDLHPGVQPIGAHRV